MNDYYRQKQTHIDSQMHSARIVAERVQMMLHCRCQKHLTDLGADYAAARLCVLAHRERIEKAVVCSKKSLGEM